MGWEKINKREHPASPGTQQWTVRILFIRIIYWICFLEKPIFFCQTINEFEPKETCVGVSAGYLPGLADWWLYGQHVYHTCMVDILFVWERLVEKGHSDSGERGGIRSSRKIPPLCLQRERTYRDYLPYTRGHGFADKLSRPSLPPYDPCPFTPSSTLSVFLLSLNATHFMLYWQATAETQTAAYSSERTAPSKSRVVVSSCTYSYMCILL